MFKNHNMAMNMPDIINPLRNDLYSFLNEESDYEIKVTRFARHDTSYFPTVELSLKNSITGTETLNRYEQYEDLEFEINIYAKTKKDNNGKMLAEVKIAEDIMYKINEFFDVKFGMKRTLCQPAPDLDLNIYRIIMRYTCSYNKRRNIFIRK